MREHDHSAGSWEPSAGIDGLNLAHLPAPIPGRDEVLVANTAIALNPVDWQA